MKRIGLLTALICCINLVSQAQNVISGKIVLKNGEPAANVNLELKELKLFAISDTAGVFSFSNIGNGTYHLLATSAGLQKQEIKVTVLNNETYLEKVVLAENVNDLEVVILTSNKGLNKVAPGAGKIAINPMDLPQAITVVGQGVIRDQQTQRLSDIVKNVNGVYLAGARASVQETFYARGYNFSSSNMFKNGTRVNTGTLPEVSSLEKVEILKGSAAILYGNVAPGGIINMVTKQPKFKKGGEISLRTGSYGLIKPSFDLYTPINHTVAVRLNGTYEKADSYRDGVQSERFYVNPSVLFKLGKKTELLLQGDYLDTRFTPDFGIGSLADTAIPDVPRSQFVGTNWQYNKVKQATATATLRQTINEQWSVNTTASYQVFNRDYYGVERIQAKADGKWARPLGKILTQEDYIIGNIDLVGKVKTGKIRHTLLIGADADRYLTEAFTFDVTGKTYDTVNILKPDLYNRRTDIPVATKITKTSTPINRFGAYIQDLVSISEKVKLLAGVRWSTQKAEPVSTHYLAKDSVGKGKATSVAAFSPKIGVVYRPTKQLSAFVSYSNSFSPNSGTDIYGNGLAASLIDQYEVGIKNELFHGKLSANLTFYRIVNNNLAQTAQFTANGTANNNTSLKEFAGQTTSDGVEIDIAGEPVKGLSVMAGYSYNNMRFTKTKQGKGFYVEGERLVNTPANTANTNVFYRFHNGSLKGLKLGAGAYYIGKRFGGWNNTQQQTQRFSRLIAVDDFTTVDVSAGYSWKKVSLIAKVANLFNTYNYYVHENYSVNPIAPRQFISTVSFKF